MGWLGCVARIAGGGIEGGDGFLAIDAGTILAHIDMDAAGFMGAMDGAAERLEAFAEDELPGAVAAATGVLDEQMNSEAGVRAANDWMQGVCAGIDAASGALEGSAYAAASGAVGAAASEMDAGAGRGIGEAMVSGMAQGVRAGAGGLYVAMSSVASQAVRRAKAALAIHSPSGVFADEVGAWIPAGIGEGIREHAQDALTPLEDVRRGMVSAASGLGVRAGAAMSGTAAYDSAGSVRIEVTGDWTVRSESDRDEIIAAISERIGEEIRRR